MLGSDGEGGDLGGRFLLAPQGESPTTDRTDSWEGILRMLASDKTKNVEELFKYAKGLSAFSDWWPVVYREKDRNLHHASIKELQRAIDAFMECQKKMQSHPTHASILLLYNLQRSLMPPGRSTEHGFSAKLMMFLVNEIETHLASALAEYENVRSPGPQEMKNLVKHLVELVHTSTGLLPDKLDASKCDSDSLGRAGCVALFPNRFDPSVKEAFEKNKVANGEIAKEKLANDFNKIWPGFCNDGHRHYSRGPVVCYLFLVLEHAFSRGNFGVLDNARFFEYLHDPEMETLCWTTIGPLLEVFEARGALTPQEILIDDPGVRKAFAEIGLIVMPRFIEQLLRLQGELESQIRSAEAHRAKMMSYAVAVLITVGQLLGSMVTKLATHYWNEYTNGSADA